MVTREAKHGRTATPAETEDIVAAYTELAENWQWQKRMLDVSVDCIKIIRPDGTLSHMNRSGCLALGVPVDETEFGMVWLGLLPKEIRDRGRRALNAARKGRTARFAGKSEIPGQKPQYWDNILTPIAGQDGAVTAILCVSRDVTTEREAQRRLRSASELDELTGLLNRRSFKARLKRLMLRAREQDSSVGLLLIDLDHFKRINDAWGHEAGDQLLRTLARRFDEAVPPNGFAARLGGDEFAIVLADVDDDALLRAADEMLHLVDDPVTYRGRILSGGMTIGCALYPRDGADLSTLLRRADVALNDLKASGRGAVRVFDRRMDETELAAAHQLELAWRIIRDGTIEAHYQPKVNLDDGRIVGLEALLRWRDDTGQLQPPSALAEAFGSFELATALTELVVESVLGDLAAWQHAGLEPVTVSINCAPIEFLRDDYAQRLLNRIDESGIAPHLIEVEIPPAAIDDRTSDATARAVRLLRDHGVRVALEPLGSADSAFRYLRDGLVNTLKVNRATVRRAERDPLSQALVRSIPQIGADLSLEVIAEGIETNVQRDTLHKLGYRLGQGFLFSQPVDAHTAARMLSAIATKA